MIRHSTPVDGCFIIEPDRRGDARGFFSRVYDAATFADAGLAANFVQVNNSLSSEAGTLRGLHYQVAPHGEVKLLRCIAGSIFDVVLDLRDGSRTFGKWAGAELSATNRRLMYVPRGCAHGFLTLAPDSEVIYFVDVPYAGGHERIVRWDDPRFAIEWPSRPVVLSDKDRTAPDFDSSWHASGY